MSLTLTLCPMHCYVDFPSKSFFLSIASPSHTLMLDFSELQSVQLIFFTEQSVPCFRTIPLTYNRSIRYVGSRSWIAEGLGGTNMNRELGRFL